MSALGQGFHDQQQQLQLYKERYEKLRERVMDVYYPQLTTQEFDKLVDSRGRIQEEISGYPI